MAVKQVAGVVLAAGESRRMGRLKALLPFGNRTVIEQVLHPLLQSDLVSITVVLGHRAEEIAAVLKALPVHLVTNPHYRDGMTTSVQAALRHITPLPDAYLLALVDQPQLGLTPVQRVLTGNGNRGHPIILAARYRQDVLDLGPDQGLNLVTRGHPDDTLELPMSDDDILRDMDYQEEYEAELQRWQSRAE